MPDRILRSPNDLNNDEIRALYANFDAPITEIDCGEKCAPHNPSGKPFCCDICEAVPAAYESEWSTLQKTSKLWHPYRGDECETQGEILAEDEMPKGMLPLACLGHLACERENRLLSCRQFPFFPYVTSNYEFTGLAYDWTFEDKCWIISHLDLVTDAYREAFIQTFDQIFALFQDEFDSYALRSEEMREAFAEKGQGFVIILRDGSFGRIDPLTDDIQPMERKQLPRFGVYRE
jgi:hypothetical protein